MTNALNGTQVAIGAAPSSLLNGTVAPDALLDHA
jgi:hypothetical protein